MRVVVDTSVWASALEFAERRGKPWQAIQRAVSNDEIAICAAIENEIYRTMQRSFQWSYDRVQRELQPFLVLAVRVTLHGTVKVCRDPKDDMVLECAERAGADLIVTGDKDLLVLGSFGKTRIVTAAQYLADDV